MIVGGKVRKWKRACSTSIGRCCAVSLRTQRDYVFNAAGIPQDLFRRN